MKEGNIGTILQHPLKRKHDGGALNLTNATLIKLHWWIDGGPEKVTDGVLVGNATDGVVKFQIMEALTAGEFVGEVAITYLDGTYFRQERAIIKQIEPKQVD